MNTALQIATRGLLIKDAKYMSIRGYILKTYWRESIGIVLNTGKLARGS